MTHVTSMLETYPKDLGNIDRQKLAECIAACFECAQTCTACADACLAEDMVAELTECIRKNLDCADVCAATGAAARASRPERRNLPNGFRMGVHLRKRGGPIGSGRRGSVRYEPARTASASVASPTRAVRCFLENRESRTETSSKSEYATGVTSSVSTSASD